MVKDKLLGNIKMLQDLKFEIYSRSTNLDFHSFDLYSISIGDKTIDLSEWIIKYKDSHQLDEIAEMIVQRYQL